MARPTFEFEFNNKSENQFTNYQKLIFRYLLGALVQEHETSFKNSKINVITDYNTIGPAKYLKISFYGVNMSLLKYLIKSFPVPGVNDINYSEHPDHNDIIIFDHKMQIQRETITTINFIK